MAWGGHKAQAEALNIVIGVVKSMDLQLAAIARTGIDLANRKTTAKVASRRSAHRVCKLAQGTIFGRRRLLCQWRFDQAFEE